ncbi:unnamed protein product [Mytilus edulis]|uniref:DSL domain-containing protein n=1 Tax=Mytilus edulis TaxID=6550 RepID=A0A8S3QMQ1_MYTED|nr:unnamed protein product [Mytilus edulis]
MVELAQVVQQMAQLAHCVKLVLTSAVVKGHLHQDSVHVIQGILVMIVNITVTLTTCSGHGTCSVWGTCICNSNYVGHRCDSQCHESTTCSGHGKCTSTGTCVCDPCYHGGDCSMSCNSQGQCVGDECQCDDCHLGNSVNLNVMDMVAAVVV